MEDSTLVQSSFSATINAPIEKVDIPSWCFTLPESEYQACSPAHYSAGSTTAPDGRRMSINVEVLGGSMIVQHYVEEIGQPDHLRLVSTSDVFTPAGRTRIGVTWDLAVRKIDDKTCEFTNTVQRSLEALLGTCQRRKTGEGARRAGYLPRWPPCVGTEFEQGFYRL